MTASPAADSTMTGTKLKVTQLQEMLQANLYLLTDQDEDIAQVRMAKRKREEERGTQGEA